MDTIRAIKTDAVIYLSGPMTGLPDYNYPAFNAMAAQLRRHGFTVVNPAELNADRPDGAVWSDYLRRDIAALMGCTHIVLLPGWKNSRGARIEVSLAGDLGMSIHFAEALAL